MKTAKRELRCNTISRDDWIRTSDPQHPMLVRYRTALRPVTKKIDAAAKVRLKCFRKK